MLTNRLVNQSVSGLPSYIQCTLAMGEIHKPLLAFAQESKFSTISIKFSCILFWIESTEWSFDELSSCSERSFLSTKFFSVETELTSLGASFSSIVTESVFDTTSTVEISADILSLASTSLIKDLTASQFRCMSEKPMLDRERFFFIKE